MIKVNDVLEKFSAGELLEWMRKQDLDIFLKEKIEENEQGESFIKEVIDVDKIQEEYLKSIVRYNIIKRGSSLYIFDNQHCMEILRLRFSPDNYEEVQKTAESLINSLNNRTMSFVPKYGCK